MSVSPLRKGEEEEVGPESGKLFALNDSGNGSGKMQISSCKGVWEGNLLA